MKYESKELEKNNWALSFNHPLQHYATLKIHNSFSYLLIGDGGRLTGNRRAGQVPGRVGQVEGVAEGGHRHDQLVDRGTQSNHNVDQGVLDGLMNT